MKHMKKSFLCLLALLIVSGSCPSCSDSGGKDPQTADTTGGETENAVEETAETEFRYADRIEAVDYNGWTVTLANDPPSSEYFSMFTVEELTGDAFNDSIYERNSRIMDKFNVKITENCDGAPDLIKNSVTAGTQDIAFGQVLHYDCMSLISSGYIHPINTMPVFDLSQPYWDKGAQETLMIDGLLWYGYCTLGFDFYESMAMLFCNGFLLDNAGITETPMDLYYAKKWTLEAMYGMITQVARDVDGDGKMTASSEDIFGWSGREFEYLPSLYSSGVSLIREDPDNGGYVMNLTDEGVMAVGEWLQKIINDKTLSFIGWNDTTRDLFKEGRSLFYSRLLGDFRNLRDKEDDYTLICYPSLNEGDIEHVYVQNPFAILIPADVEDTTRLGTIMEAMIADTYDNVMDPYINKAIIGKGARDEESAALFRELCEKRVYDMNYALNLFDPIKAYNSAMKKSTYASLMSKYEPAYAKKVAELIEKLETVGAPYKD